MTHNARYVAFQNIHPPLQVPQQYIDMQRHPDLRTEVNGTVSVTYRVIMETMLFLGHTFHREMTVFYHI